MSVCVLLINMSPIEFFEIPEQCEVLLQIGNKTLRCSCEIRNSGTVSEVYDESGEIIATSNEDLARLGVSKATVIAKHEVDMGQVIPCF